MSKNTDAMRTMLLQIDQRLFGDIFEDVGMEAQRSIVEGSELTGAPGQPVQTGNLKSSYTRWYDSPTKQTIGTNVVYAPFIEDGVGAHGPLMLRSAVGGFHSIAHTENSLQHVLDVVTVRHGGR